MGLSGFKITAAAIAAMVALSTAAAAQNESVLFSFKGQRTGRLPNTRLLLDSTGTLYGVVSSGGEFKWGIAYALSKSGGRWKQTILHQFGNGSDGLAPSSGLVQDASGTLYGTTGAGGTYGGGTVYALGQSGGVWTEQILYSFGAQGGDGVDPESDLLFDKTSGALYGTTRTGGTNGCGTVYQLARSGGVWTETILFDFETHNGYCSTYYSGLHEDSTGALYGATTGYYGEIDGTVYQLTNSNGVWTKTVLHDFGGGSDGLHPVDIDLNSSGEIYGVTDSGGLDNSGIVFGLAQSGGTWTETLIYSFQGPPDGEEPVGIHLARKTGALDVTTWSGGGLDRGAVVQLSASHGVWVENVLYGFLATPDGAEPAARVIEDKSTGTLFGTTMHGGSKNRGTVYQITQ